MDDCHNTERLAEIIADRHQLLEQMRQLARRQSVLIQEGDMTRLMSLLSSKQKLMNQLQEIERRLDPFRSQDPDSRQWRSPHERTRCRQQAERCEALLSEIMLEEKQCEAQLQQRRDQTATQLQGLNTASQATHAYTRNPAAPRGHLDLSSEE